MVVVSICMSWWLSAKVLLPCHGGCYNHVCLQVMVVVTIYVSYMSWRLLPRMLDIHAMVIPNMHAACLLHVMAVINMQVFYTTWWLLNMHVFLHAMVVVNMHASYMSWWLFKIPCHGGFQHDYLLHVMVVVNMHFCACHGGC